MSRFTWVHTKVNQIIPVGDATPEKTLFFKIVDSLLAVPSAAIVQSCDSTTTSASNLITSASAVTYAAAGTAHSWAVISFTTGGQMMVSANDQYATPGIGLMWSPAAGFTGGTTTADPTATDQVDTTFYSSGMNLAGTKPWVYHAMWTTDGRRFHGALFSNGGAMNGLLSMMYIDDPAAALVSSSPRGIAFLGDGFDVYGTSLAYVGQLSSTGAAILPISSGLVNTRNASLVTGRSVAGQFSANVLDSKWPLYSMDAFADSTVVSSGTKIVGRLGNLADMYIVSQDVASDNNGHGVHAPRLGVITRGEKWAPFGGSDVNAAVLLPWDPTADFKVFGDGSDPSPTSTFNAEIIDVEVTGTSPLSTYTWNTSKINQTVLNTDPHPAGHVIYNLITSLLAVDGAVLSGSNAIGSAAAIVGDNGVPSNGHSWACIKFTNGGQILITCAGTPIANPNFNVLWSPQATFTGGNANVDPTGTDILYPSNYSFGWSSITADSVLHVIWSTDGKRIRAAFISQGGGGFPGFCNGAMSIEVLDSPIGSAATSPPGFCAFASGWAQGGRPFDGMRWVGNIAGRNVILQAVSMGVCDHNLSSQFPAANVADPNHFGGFGRTATVVGPSPLYTMWAFCDGFEAADVQLGSSQSVQGTISGYIGKFADMYTADGYLTANAGGSDSTVFPKILLLDNGERWCCFSGNNDYSATAIKWDGSDQKTTADGTDPSPTPTVASAIVDPVPTPPTPPPAIKPLSALRVAVPNDTTEPVIVSANLDPTAVGITAPVGSTLMRTDSPDFYLKTGLSDGAWSSLVQTPLSRGNAVLPTQQLVASFFDDLIGIGPSVFQVITTSGSAGAGLAGTSDASTQTQWIGVGMLQTNDQNDDTVLFAGSGKYLAYIQSGFDQWTIVARILSRCDFNSTGDQTEVTFGTNYDPGDIVGFAAGIDTYGNGNWWAIHPSASPVDTGVARAFDANAQVLQVDYSSAGSAVIWKINGVVVNSNNRGSSSNWRPCVRNQAVSAGNKSNQCFIDYIGWKLIKPIRS